MSSKPAKRIYGFGPFLVDAAEGLLLRDGQPIPLTPKAFETLIVLVENSGHVIGKDELMQRVWPDSFVEENNLSQNISILRKALGDNTGGPRRYIETVPKRGYRFTANVNDLSDEGERLLILDKVRGHVTIEEKEVEPFLAAERRVAPRVSGE